MLFRSIRVSIKNMRYTAQIWEIHWKGEATVKTNELEYIGTVDRNKQIGSGDSLRRDMSTHNQIVFVMEDTFQTKVKGQKTEKEEREDKTWDYSRVKELAVSSMIIGSTFVICSCVYVFGGKPKTPQDHLDDMLAGASSNF